MTGFSGRKPEIAERVKVVLLGLPAVVVATLLVVAIIYAWSEPGSLPPSGNVLAPLNVSTTTQYKGGALGIAGIFETATQTQLAVLGGNVGIGTTTPSAKLHIAGTPGVDGIKFPDGSVQTRAATASPYVECTGLCQDNNDAQCSAGWTRIKLLSDGTGCSAAPSPPGATKIVRTNDPTGGSEYWFTSIRYDNWYTAVEYTPPDSGGYPPGPGHEVLYFGAQWISSNGCYRNANKYGGGDAALPSSCAVCCK